MNKTLGLFIVLLLTLSACDKPAETHLFFDEPKMQLPGAAIYIQAIDQLKQQNTPAALPLLEQAANLGNAEAQYQLGLIYARGDTVTQDFNIAHDWLMKAALLAHPKAHYQLGMMYAKGDGVERNHEESLVWLWSAASYGDKNAKTAMRLVINQLDTLEYERAEERMKEVWKKLPHDIFVPPESSSLH